MKQFKNAYRDQFDPMKNAERRKEMKRTVWNKNRKRNIILNFRVSEEEHDMIINRAELSGLPRNEFYINSCLYQAISTTGNIKTFTKIQRTLNQVMERLMEISSIEEVSEVDIEAIRAVLDIYSGLKPE